MKRDMELIRKILIAVEAKESEFDFKELEIEGHEQPEISGHLHMLADAGYVEVEDLTTMGKGFRLLVPKRLTHDGHEFLESMRNDSVWKEVTAKAKEQGGSLPFEIMKALGDAFLRKKLGL